ncbi:MAG: prolyl oligopeptidase family serine peptidase [Planctomycetes bacterium]|nr:prolyl oligopeptidase family serine peptidase [Planctomycetota bacterium]
MFRALFCGVLAVILPIDANAQSYQRPPKAITDILDVPPPPSLSLSPVGDTLLFVQSSRYPSIEEVAAPQLRLAGLRLDPKTNGPARPFVINGLTLLALPDGKPTPIVVPAHGKAGFPYWSPDGKRFALTITTPKGIELWVAELRTGGILVRVPDVLLNATIGDAFQWMPGSESLIVQTIPEKRGEAPAKPIAPTGPVVQESDGKAAPVRTYQDLLQNPHDEALFSYYTTSQLAIVTPGGKEKEVVRLGEPGIYLDADPSPDGEYFLVTRVQKPFSYLQPYSAFPRVVEVWGKDGKPVRTIAELPLQDKVPIEGVPTGPRSVRWMPTQPHTLIWVEAQDDGDPRKKVEHREAVFTSAVEGRTTELMKLEQRFAGMDFFPTGNRMLIRDYDRERKWSRTFLAPTTSLFAATEPKVLFERSTQDRYGDPGSTIGRTLPSGHRVLRTGGDPAGDTIWLAGPGASPKGDRPFLDRFDVKTGKATRVFHCADNLYEEAVAVLDAKGTRFLIRRESPTEPPNYFFRDANHEVQLTKNTDPAPELRKATKQLVTTKRADGTTISFTLHLPPGHTKDSEKIPAVFYAYPVEFASADTAGQVTGSPLRFTAIGGYSHLFFLAQGYAVMEVSMPIVGPPATANDTFVDQLVSNAKAAIDKAGEFGIDTSRVGVMGHSYGAFMTANLLAHSDLFKAGIARSGAYNRTLTPFGFQNERRTFWEAPAVYAQMSPFNHANKINEPLLLIHGAADNNPGTFTVQSERLYAAVRANGGTVRLVLLPHESHGYEARESVEHVLSEQFAWFDKYVKNAKNVKPR